MCVHGAAPDWVDSFYKFVFDDLAEFFCLDLPVEAHEVGITSVWNHGTSEYDGLFPDDYVFPALATLPMGWSWSLFACHSALCEAMVCSEVARGVPETMIVQALFWNVTM